MTCSGATPLSAMFSVLMALVYISMYCLNLLILILSPFRKTLIPVQVPAMSYTLRFTSASKSSSISSMPNLLKSGLKVIFV